ncbi:hypothetical protein [Mycobacteroides abscessus]|uniref:hypothetical protein n=1 Tax=Mycobacteroides abscessus TaxID=36809 RepID=UPI0011C4213F|nr:hypothetical protein [Mycobacteroides abscessus]
MDYSGATAGLGNEAQSDDVKMLTVGAGLAFHEGLDAQPRIMLHINGGRTNTDAEADLTIAEAVYLRLALDKYINAAAEVIAGGVAVDIAEIARRRVDSIDHTRRRDG